MKHLRKYIRKILLEAMIPPSSVESKYAILTDFEEVNKKPYKQPARTYINYIMYDWEKAQELLHEYGDPKFCLNQSIKAVLRVYTPMDDTCNNAWEVVRSAAEDGLGPTLYDLVMSHSPRGLMPDRESVSQSAREVWQAYANKRPDVEKQFLDHGELNVTKFTEDDCMTYGAQLDGGSIRDATINVAKHWLDKHHPKIHNGWKNELESWGGFKFHNGMDYHDRMIPWMRKAFPNVGDWDGDAFREYYHEETWRNLIDWHKGEFEDPEYLNLSYQSDSSLDSFNTMLDNHANYEYHVMNIGYIPDHLIHDMLNDIKNSIEDMVDKFFHDRYRG